MALALILSFALFPTIALSLTTAHARSNGVQLASSRNSGGTSYDQTDPPLRTVPGKSSTPIFQPGWAYRGCYSDPSSTHRLLSTRVVSSRSAGVTQQMCVAICNAEGYHCAGVESGSECWWGHLRVDDLIWLRGDHLTLSLPTGVGTVYRIPRFSHILIATSLAPVCSLK